MSIKNIRNLTIGKKAEFKTKEIIYEGETITFKQPSLKERRDIIDASSNGDKLDTVSLQINSVITLTYDVEGNQVFSREDYDVLLSQPSGGFLDKFSEECLKLLGGNSQEEENA